MKSTKPAEGKGFERGFTLIELLLVLFIIAIMAAVVSLTVGGGGETRKVQSEAQRLAALMRLATEEAIMQGQEVGVELFEDSYRFLIWDDGEATAQAEADEEDQLAVQQAIGASNRDGKAQEDSAKWVLLDYDRFFAEHQLESGLIMRLVVEDSPISIRADGADSDGSLLSEVMNASILDGDETERLEPNILVLATGELTPFEVELYHEENPEFVAKVTGNLLGQIDYKDPNREEDWDDE